MVHNVTSAVNGSPFNTLVCQVELQFYRLASLGLLSGHQINKPSVLHGSPNKQNLLFFAHFIEQEFRLPVYCCSSCSITEKTIQNVNWNGCSLQNSPHVFASVLLRYQINFRLHDFSHPISALPSFHW